MTPLPHGGDGAGVPRTAVLAVSAAAVLGTAVELALIGHWHGAVQALPWAGLAAASAANTLVLVARGPRALLVARGLAAAVAVVGGLGVLEHLLGNLAIASEVRPDAPPAGLLLEGLRGRLPLLAPGTVALPAVLTVLATHRHPALARPPADPPADPPVAGPRPRTSVDLSAEEAP